MPEVSVVIPAYNHDQFVHECIQSILDQTYQDFEIVITDDGSADQTVSKIKEFKDPRINLYEHHHNRGAVLAQNHGINQSVGRYIAIMNSDDVWLPAKLEKQVGYLDAHPEIGAVFSQAVFINDAGRVLAPSEYNNFHIFDQENRSRFAWLNRFFWQGNCLCHPSVLIRRKCYEETGLYTERQANLPDLDMWVRFCLKFDLHILDEKLVNFRIRANKANASGDKLGSLIRGHFELKQILDHYLEIQDSETFLQIFPEAARYGQVESGLVPYFLGRLALEVPDNTAQLWGLESLYEVLGNPDRAAVLENKYGFSCRDFLALTEHYNVFGAGLMAVHPPFSRRMGYSINLEYQRRLYRLALRMSDYIKHFSLRNIFKF